MYNRLYGRSRGHREASEWEDITVMVLKGAGPVAPPLDNAPLRKTIHRTDK